MTNCDYENKISDDEIISSLEVIATTSNCDECKLRKRKRGYCNCSQIAATTALDIINRQKTEIEQWKEEANKYQKLWCMAVDDIEKAKAEAYKEFAERLKRSTVMACVGNKIYAVATSKGVDNILKEMLGEE